MVTVKCLHCDSDNDPRQTSGYCDSCGKKLPPAPSFRTRRADRGELTTDGPEEVELPGRRSAEALFTAAVLWLICGGLLLVLGPVFLSVISSQFVPLVMLSTILGLACFALLGWWASRKPRQAVITALIVFFLGAVGYIVVDPSTAILTLVYTPVLGYLIKGYLISARDSTK
jgi:hypothetical protein